MICLLKPSGCCCLSYNLRFCCLLVLLIYLVLGTIGIIPDIIRELRKCAPGKKLTIFDRFNQDILFSLILTLLANTPSLLGLYGWWRKNIAFLKFFVIVSLIYVAISIPASIWILSGKANDYILCYFLGIFIRWYGTCVVYSYYSKLLEKSKMSYEVEFIKNF